MSDYAQQFKLRMQRAKERVDYLSERLDKIKQCIDDDDLNAVDNETAELISMLANDVNNEVQEGKRALQWHKRGLSDE